MEKRKIIVGISGASGAPIAVTLLKALQERLDWETHLVISESGRITIREESGVSVEEVEALADAVYNNADTGAVLASGSFRTDGMVIVPCSMKTLAGIHAGYADNLIQRAADVTIKERRKLVLAARECPLSPIHLRNMYELSQIGICIVPTMVSYYNHPKSIEDVTHHIVGKILDSFGIEYGYFRRWEGVYGG
jgi:4-hydroxy-3-polyprenylbenzoate decarboxylase